MFKQTNIYLRMLDTKLAPKTDEEINLYVKNFLDGLQNDLRQINDKKLAQKIIDKIKLRF